ncbi:MAG: histidine phosphatase family protein [Deltaproteobacteria bacterium]|nr:histidine phosphatase family protein [Deltaproteobacteria bacterium]MCW5800787.1 histidine phosphatase family protein [Deltaproteobacteria bacterium]
MNILLVRHGETAWNREGRYQGRTDVPLSPDGQGQVTRLAQRLASVPIAVAVASPLSRARTTAEAVMSGRGVDVELDAALVEISHGEWEGKLAADLETSHATMLDAWRSSPPRHLTAGPGAESLGDVEDRAWPALERIAARLGPDDTALVAAHDAVNRVLLCRILGLPVERMWRFRQAPATLNVLSGPSLAELVVVRLNDSEHVAPLLSSGSDRVHKAL